MRQTAKPTMETYCDEIEKDITITYNYYAAEKPVYNYGDGTGYPGSPAEVEILSVIDEDNNEIDVDILGNEHYEQLVFEYIDNEEPPY